MTLFDVEKQIEEMMISGLYPVVQLNQFKNFDNGMTEYTKEYTLETIENYKEYLKMIDELPEKFKKAFLETLKKEEIKHNQETENENPFLISLYENIGDMNSIDLGMKLLEKKDGLISQDLKKIHYRIMQGTSSSEEMYEFRRKNNIVVEGMTAGRRDVHFIPIDKKDIPKAVKLICEYLNSQATTEEDILIKPFTAHALIAGLQGFTDGNTRLARLVSHLKIWQLSKQYGITNVNLPAIYMSKSFYMMRGGYRDKIRNIMVDKTNESWNSWYNFNLNAFNEQLHFGKTNLEELKRRI